MTLPFHFGSTSPSHVLGRSLSFTRVVLYARPSGTRSTLTRFVLSTRFCDTPKLVQDTLESCRLSLMIGRKSSIAPVARSTPGSRPVDLAASIRCVASTVLSAWYLMSMPGWAFENALLSWEKVAGSYWAHHVNEPSVAPCWHV